MKILRTPDERFADISDFPYEPRYADVGPFRMHYVAEGAGDPILCLHGEPSWCYLYRKMIPTLSQVGQVIAPDLIGFGRSDKPSEKSDYSFSMHRDALVRFIEVLNLNRITLVCQDWGGLLGLTIATELPNRFARLVIMNTGLPTGEEKMTEGFMRWRAFAERSTDLDVGRLIQQSTVTDLSAETMAAYDAPFPDVSYKAGALQFPLLVPISPDSPSAPPMKKAREVLKTWTKPVLIAFSDKDPVTAGGDRWFRKLIPSAQQEPEIVIRDAAHFLQEDKGEEIAEHIAAFITRRPL